MSVIVGYSPEGGGNGSLELGQLLAQSADLPLVVTCVIPDRWQPVSKARSVDSEYERFLRAGADEAIAEAQAYFADNPGLDVTYDVRTARSAAAGLLTAATEHDGKILAVGSSYHGAWGHIAVGTTSDRLLHSAHLPVAVAPRGHRNEGAQRVGRVTVAVDGSPASRAVLAQAAEVAATIGASLRVVTFAVRGQTMYPPEVGLHAEDKVLESWAADAQWIVQDAVAALDSGVPCTPELHVARGRSWAEALDEPGWQPGEVLVIGSSSSQPLLARVFVGSTATRILRHSPVPVAVVP